MLNLYDTVDEQIFFNKFFSKDMFNEILIGNVELNFPDSIVVNIHTKAKPKMEIPKYGQWGNNYNVIVFELWARLDGNISIHNRNMMTFHRINVTKTDTGYLFSQQGDDWSFTFQILDGFLFRKVSTYTN